MPGVEFSKLSQGKMDFADFNASMQVRFQIVIMSSCDIIVWHLSTAARVLYDNLVVYSTGSMDQSVGVVNKH